MPCRRHATAARQQRQGQHYAGGPFDSQRLLSCLLLSRWQPGTVPDQAPARRRRQREAGIVWWRGPGRAAARTERFAHRPDLAAAGGCKAQGIRKAVVVCGARNDTRRWRSGWLGRCRRRADGWCGSGGRGACSLLQRQLVQVPLHGHVSRVPAQGMEWRRKVWPRQVRCPNQGMQPDATRLQDRMAPSAKCTEPKRATATPPTAHRRTGTATRRAPISVSARLAAPSPPSRASVRSLA